MATLSDVYHRPVSFWVAEQTTQGRWALVHITDGWPRIRRVFDTEAECRAEVARLNSIERRP